MESHDRPERLEQLKRRREQLGDEELERVQREWAEVVGAVEAEREGGTDPGEPKVQALMNRWNWLVTSSRAAIRSCARRSKASTRTRAPSARGVAWSARKRSSTCGARWSRARPDASTVPKRRTLGRSALHNPATLFEAWRRAIGVL
jgi:hypothetical protein